MKRILITGAGGSAAYNFIDALNQSKEKFYFVGVDARPQHLELVPAHKTYLVPRADESGYVGALNKIVKREKIDFVHPQPDVEVAFLARHHSKINASIFLPDSETVDLCHDKMSFAKRLSELSVPVPEAHHIEDKKSLQSSLNKLLKKGDRVWLRAIRGAGSRASLPVNNMHQASGWIDYWHTFRGLDYQDFMASEFLPGAEFAWQSLWHNGELITSQARERIEYIFGNLTPSGQTSSPSVAKTVNRDDVNAAGDAAVWAVSDKPHGVFCVDMKADSQDRPKVTEINVGRFFTTSNFFAHAGLNMPAMYIDLGLGKKLKEQPPKYNPLPDNLYWVRMIDMGFKLVKDGKWNSKKILD